MNKSKLFHQLKSKETEKQNEKLDRSLNVWAKKHFIAVESLTSLRKKFPERFNIETLGVSDFKNNVIGLADDRHIDTMAEEVAHFAIELMGNSERVRKKNTSNFLPIGLPLTIREAAKKTSQTKIYLDVKKDYKHIYKKEIDFQKEALAKILAQEIVYIFRVKEFMRERQSRYTDPWINLLIARDDIIYILNRVFGITTIRKNDIEISVKSLAKNIVNQEILKRHTWSRLYHYKITTETIQGYAQYNDISEWTERNIMY
tara:strand:+ start:67 stop:843 length:777 start_codon:yes stop_codon:yes gene_type:complete